MNVLSLGMNDIRKPVDGLPEYLRYMTKFFQGRGDKICHINLTLEKVNSEDGVEVVDIAPNVKQILVSVPGFFQDEETDVFKYTLPTKVFLKVMRTFAPDLIIQHDWYFTPVLMGYDQPINVLYIVHLYSKGLNKILGNDGKGSETMALAEKSEVLGMVDIADYVVHNSSATREDVAEEIPQVDLKSSAIPLGVDKAVYKPMPNLGSKIILYMGRLDQQKGISQFLENVKANYETLKQNGFQVWVVGDGQEFEKPARFSVAGMIKMFGRLSDEEKMKALQAAEYMVFPSVYEPYGLALNEGLATGKICIASDLGGHKEQIKNKKNGILVKDGKFMEAIFELESKPKLKEKIIKNAPASANDIADHFKGLTEAINDFLRPVNGVKKRSGR